jgi:small subunit ribosomal protein S16
MALKLRLRKQGRNNTPFYRIVVTNVRNKRDGKYVESVGWYDPLKSDDLNLQLDAERVRHWLDQGVEPTEKVLHLIAKGAPEVYRFRQEKLLEQKAKAAAKRKKKKA